MHDAVQLLMSIQEHTVQLLMSIQQYTREAPIRATPRMIHVQKPLLNSLTSRTYSEYLVLPPKKIKGEESLAHGDMVIDATNTGKITPLHAIARARGHVELLQQRCCGDGSHV